MTLKQVAAYLQTSRATVRRYIADGQLRTLKIPGGHHRIRRADVQAMLTEYPLIPQQDQQLDEVLDVVAILDRICRWRHEQLKAEMIAEVERRTEGIRQEVNQLKGYCLTKVITMGRVRQGDGNAILSLEVTCQDGQDLSAWPVK